MANKQRGVGDDDVSRKLRQIAKLEKANGVRGVHFAVNVKDGETVTLDESVDYVIAVIKNSVKLAKRTDLVKPGYCPPEGIS